MTATVTIIDNLYDSNDATGRKSIFATVSLTNPYTAGGELVTVSSWFKTKFLGGRVTAIEPSVAIAAVGAMALATIRADTSSYTTVKLQLLNVGLTGTANAGLLVDSTVANTSNSTCTINLIGY